MIASFPLAIDLYLTIRIATNKNSFPAFEVDVDYYGITKTLFRVSPHKATHPFILIGGQRNQ